MTTALVVEPAETSGTVQGLLARHPDWTAERAAGPDAALDRLETETFEVLLADADSVDGHDEWLATVRERYPNLPVVLVNADRESDAIVKALLLGAATYVPRSSVAHDLVTTVERLLALCGRGRGKPLNGCLGETTHRYVLPNDREQIPSVLCHVQEELERFKVCGRPDRLRVAVALEEALTNAIVHGNLEVSSKLREFADDRFERAIAERKAATPYRDRRATLTAAFRPGEAVFRVLDEGPGFDPSGVPDPTDLENLCKPHGRGLLLMRTFMDAVDHNPRGNEVTLVKRSK